MSEFKCPFCNGELVGTIGHPICRNQNCVMCDDPMPQDLLEELDRTRKALDVAVDALKDIRCVYTGDQTTKPSTMFGRAAGALNKIQELEQKEEQ